MAKVASFIATVALTFAIVLAHYESDCQEGWSSCDASLWVSPKYNPQDPLSSYTPGEIRGPLEYEIKFSCRGRRNGYYADLDHSCKVWHYCNTTREINPYNGLATWTYTHFSYACLEEGTRYDQVQKECVPESKSIVRCRDSEYYYPTGDYVYDVPVVSSNRLVPVRCPTSVSDVKCSIQKDHINLQGCPESPGAVVKFYSSLSDLVPSPVSDADAPTTSPSVALYSDNAVPSVVAEVADVPDSVPAAVPSAVPALPVSQPALYNEQPSAPVVPVNQPRLREPSQGELSARKTVYAATKNVYAPAGGRKIASPAHAGRKSVAQSFTNQYVDGEQLIFPRRLSQPLVVPTIAAAPAVPASVPLRDVAFEPVPVAPSNSSESAEADFLGLPVGSTKILGDKIDTSFDCSGRAYGYYADVKNQCKVYHVCSPKTDEFGVRFYEHFSFVCAEGLIFDQRKITCVPSREASHQCSDSERYFEKTSEQFHKEHESFIANKKVVTTEATPAEVSPVRVAVAAAPAPVTGRSVTILRVKSIEPEVDSPKKYSKVNAPGKSVGPPRVFLKEPTVPTRVDSDEYDHDAEEVALRGDQSPVARGEQVNEPAPVSTAPPPPPSPSPAVKRPPTLSQRPVNYGSKVAYPSPSHGKRHYAQRPVAQAPVKKYYAAPAAPAPVPTKRVVYRLKKGNRAPVSYSSRVAPYLGERKFAHNPRIAQQVPQAHLSHGPKRIQHSPSIAQGVSTPGISSGPKHISHNPSISQQIAPEESSPVAPQSISHNPSVSQYVSGPASAPAAPQALSHNPSISQGLGVPSVSSSPQDISHNPSISQYIGSPASSPAAPQALSHNPSISQGVGAPSISSAPKHISHNPSISQYIGSPESTPVAPQSVSHNPSVSQYVSAPGPAPVAPQALSHSPSIVQYIGAPAAPAARGASISHAPMISQYVPDFASSYGSGAQSISHNPSIHQVIVRSDSSRPSSRLTW